MNCKIIRMIKIVCLAILFLSCKPQYRIADTSWQIVEMNQSYDTPLNPAMEAFVQSYKSQLDTQMKEVIGSSAQYMNYGRPESLLTNLTSDVMKAYGDEQLSTGADVAIMNVHGHRAALPAGAITIGTLYEIYPFDNTVIFLELKGSDLNAIFDAYALMGGAGISSNVQLVIAGQKIRSALVSGKAVDPDKVYHVVTLDYLAEGNDHMAAFRNAIGTTPTGITIRDLMIDWVKTEHRKGNKVTSIMDNRIKILP